MMKLWAGAQLRAARALLRLERAELARLAGVSESTLKRLEGTDGAMEARVGTLRALEATFTARGVEFVGDGKAGAQLDLTKAGGRAAADPA